MADKLDDISENLSKIRFTLERINDNIYSLCHSTNPDTKIYEEAKELAIKNGEISAGVLQRELNIGYARAALLLDLLEANKIVGQAEGAKPRKVLINK